MRPRGGIRYYPGLRPAIPGRGAGRPRVTHPFATLLRPRGGRFASDLHVLSAPPAFILSQDQTLRSSARPRGGRTLKYLRTEGRIRNLPPPCRRRSRVHRLGFILVVAVSGSQGSARPRPVPRPPVRGGRPPWRGSLMYSAAKSASRIFLKKISTVRYFLKVLVDELHFFAIG